VFRDPTEHPLLWAEDALSMPAPMLKRWIARFGERAKARRSELALDEPPLSMRVVAGERERSSPRTARARRRDARRHASSDAARSTSPRPKPRRPARRSPKAAHVQGEQRVARGRSAAGACG
jgi:hypothetical protein